MDTCYDFEIDAAFFGQTLLLSVGSPTIVTDELPNHCVPFVLHNGFRFTGRPMLI